MITITLPPKTHKRELFPQLLKRINDGGGFNVNGKLRKFIRSLTDGNKQKIWKGESCPLCKRNGSAFPLVAVDNSNVKAKACLACKKMAVLGIGENN